MKSFLDMLQEASGGDKPRLSHAMQIAGLREFFDHYTRPVDFQVGDLVTPRSTSALKGKGEPHIVLDVVTDASYNFAGDEDQSSADFGQRLNVRVGFITSRGFYVAFWMEHHDLERFRPKDEEQPRADAPHGAQTADHQQV